MRPRPTDPPEPRQRRNVRVFAAAALFIVAACLVRAQQLPPIPVVTAALTEPIPYDPSTTVATLPNGLRYYVRNNPLPRNRAELRLVVNAGSNLEDDDQRGFAHFVEHMAFNGTKNFPGLDVQRFMQQLGMQSGAHVNARTGFDETVYQLQIPTDSVTVIDRSLQILEDFAHLATFDDGEIDKERGVILEEWRQGLGATARLRDALFPVVLRGSRYVERFPIGKPEIIQAVNHDRLKQFYADWYRPDLMAVVVVGDINPQSVENLIKAHFTPLQNPPAPRPRPDFRVPDHPGTLVAVVTDKEITTGGVAIYNKTDIGDPTTVGAYRGDIVDRLFTGMLSLRFAEIAQRPDSPFLGAQARKALFVNTTTSATLSANIKENGVDRGLAALLTETGRVAQFGFTATELERQKVNTQRALERAVGERDRQVSGSLADEYVRNFTQREPMPGIAYEFALHQRFLPEITLDEVNRHAAQWTASANRVVAITLPDRPNVEVPNETRINALIADAAAATSTAYVDSVSNRPLLDALPTPGRITDTKMRAGSRITEWKLSNGTRVVLLPTTFKQDEILFRAFKPGGVSLASDDDLVAAQTIGLFIPQSGVGLHSGQDLRRLLAGKTAQAQPFIGLNEEGVGGGGSKQDLETLFQLIYLTFTAPRADAQLFERAKETMRSMLPSALPPDAFFRDRLDTALTQNHPRARRITAESIGQMNLEASLAFYQARFSDANDFTFVFAGSFDVQEMRPLVERYVGGLPSTSRRETWRDVGVRPPTKVVEESIQRGSEPRSQVGIVFTGPIKYDLWNRTLIRAMANMVGGKLSATLREDLGGTYGVRVDTTTDRVPVESFRIAIIFNCDPARADELVRTTFREIERFKYEGPPPGQVAAIRSSLLREYETSSQQNPYLLRQMVSAYQDNEDVEQVFRMREIYDRLDVDAVRDAARDYLNTDRYVKVILFPEKK